MIDNKQEATNYAQKNDILEVIQLIDKYLDESKKGSSCSDDISSSVYNFFGAIGYKEFLTIYPKVSAFALSALAMNPDAREGLLAVIGEEDFDYFCQLLYGIIELCTEINTSEIIMASLDKARWQKCKPDFEPISELKKARTFYECKLKCIKENA